MSQIFKEAVVLSAKTVNHLRVYKIDDPACDGVVTAIQEVRLPLPPRANYHGKHEPKGDEHETEEPVPEL